MGRELTAKSKEIAEKLKSYFVFYPNFPKSGIIFWDVFALFKNHEAFKLIDLLLAEYASLVKDEGVNVIVGLEARGFLFGPLLAKYLDCTFAPVRKKGKLPGPTYRQAYELEYGDDVLEIQTDSIRNGQKVVIIDDCIATGGTLKASQELVKKCGGVILDFVVFYVIPDVKHYEDCPSVTTLVI